MDICGILPIAYPGKKISPFEHWRMSEGENLTAQKKTAIAKGGEILPGKYCRGKLPGKTAGENCREISPGNIAGENCREISPGNIAGKYYRGKLPGNIAGKYYREILPGKNRLNCGRENPPDPGKNFSLSLWASKNCCRIRGTNLCNYLPSTRIKSD